MVLAVFSCLFCLLAVTPLLPMVLATGSKPRVHLLSNVLYRSQLARLSDLAAAHVRHDAGPFQQIRNTSIRRLSHANLRRPDR